MIRKCNKPVYTTDGRLRGKCARQPHLRGNHGNDFCCRCGIRPKTKTSSYCRECRATLQTERDRKRGVRCMNYQNSGYQHTFPCGCVGVLPLRKGESNLFARWAGKCWHCRVSNIFSGSASTSKRDGYKPIDQNTPHSKVRMMMENPCVLCGEPLKWTFSNVKTPNLHHDHTTGYALGFAHPKCNSNGAGIENKCLRDFILDDVFGSERISFPLTAELLFTKIRRQQP